MKTAPTAFLAVLVGLLAGLEASHLPAIAAYFLVVLTPLFVTMAAAFIGDSE
jgi:hypothetical protein